MKYLKKYNENFQKDTGHFHDFSIYAFFEQLKSYQWNSNFNEKSVKFWSDHFIGKGVYGDVCKKVDDIYTSFSKVDIGYMEDRFLEAWDVLPSKKNKDVFLSVIYGGYERVNRENKYKYNGLMPVSNINDKERKYSIINSILIYIIHPTLFISHPSVNIRTTNDAKYVMSEIHQCINFDINNYFDSSEIVSYEYNKIKKYSVENVLKMYRAGVIIEVGGHEDYMKYPFNLRKLEEAYDDVLPSVLSDLDYEDVIWDAARGSRQFDDDKDFYENTLKILLN